MNATPFEKLRRLFRSTDAAPAPAAQPIPVRHVATNGIGRGYDAQGYRKGVKRIVVTVDGDLFKRVRADAVASRISLAAQVREILSQHYVASPRQEQ